eukprot:gene45036-56059_t
MPLFWKPYKSEVTQFIDELKAKKPTLEAEQRAGRGERPVSLPQVHADVQARGQFGVVIDDQSGLVAIAQIAQGFGFTQTTGLIAALVAVLQQGDATFQRRLHVQKKFTGQQLAVGNGVQATELRTEVQWQAAWHELAFAQLLRIAQ